MHTRTNNYWRAALGLLTVFSISTTGCNIFSGVDKPGDEQDKYAAAVSLANAGLCSDAVDLLNSIATPSDDVAVALGWAELCVGGATAGNIATSLYKFNSGSTDLTAVGVLARTMLPTSGTKSQALGLAATAFNSIADSSRRSLQLAIAQFSQAAGVLANNAGNDSLAALSQTDIAPANCVNDSANCTTSTLCTAGMSNADVITFSNFISAAATNLGSSGAASLQALSKALNTGLLGTPGRCFIFNSVIPNP